MRTQSRDTDPEAERVQIELLRKAGLPGRARLMCSLTDTVVAASRQAIARAHPEASEEEVRLIFVALWYGQDLADQVRAALARGRGEK